MYAQEVTGTLGNTTVPTLLIYSEDDPFVVLFVFSQGDDSAVEWEVARDLIHDVFTAGASGEGDVRFGLSGDQTTVSMFLSGHNGQTMVFFPADEIRSFLHHTLALVPMGSEVVNIEQEIWAWMDEERPYA